MDFAFLIPSLLLAVLLLVVWLRGVGRGKGFCSGAEVCADGVGGRGEEGEGEHVVRVYEGLEEFSGSRVKKR